MAWEDRLDCGDLIVRWGLYRDQGRWDDLADCFWPDAQIHISWFSGAAQGFVAESRRTFDASRSRMVLKHLIWPPSVEVVGERAIGETSVAILVRQKVEDFHLDNTSYARFHDRLERRDGKWRILERTGIYELDRFDAVEAPDKFARYMSAIDFTAIPAAYRYIGYRLVEVGRQIAPNAHVDGSEATTKLYEAGRAWLADGSTN